ncbi:hypothetical protein PMAYCL1PPCAC_21122, partial [Pristionchus mayeri]
TPVLSSVYTMPTQTHHRRSLLSAERHLLLHLLCSLVVSILALALTLFWTDASNRGCSDLSGNVIMIGIFTCSYGAITIVHIVAATFHFCLISKKQKVIEVTVAVTCGASGILSCGGYVAFELLNRNSTCNPSLYSFTSVFFGTAVALNACLLLGEILDCTHIEPSNNGREKEYTKEVRSGRQISETPFHSSTTEHQPVQPKQTINEPENSDYASWRKHSTSFGDISANDSFVIVPSTTAPTPKPRTVVSPPSLYPSNQLGSVSSFENLSD